MNFKVSAELKNILGRDLITSPDVAILELVKNSYDAHATKVEITFDDDYLCIADNGKGMSKDDLINKWLFVAYSAKSDGTEDQSYRSKIKQRHYAGAKGIGRMSCDRLARYLTLTTRSEGEKTEELTIDWSIFETDKQKEFDSISIPHETLESTPTFPAGQATGTILAFRGLRNLWGKDEILAIKKSLEKMINPFSGTDDDFQIEIIAPHFIDSDKDVEGYSRVNGIIENSIADILKIKTTKIESVLLEGVIRTTLSDRGIKMYEIEEPNKFPELSSATISLFYLNRAAKYSFSQRMGIQPVQYGNVFLFRNGFRILPYGNYNDDSWGINQRAQQGYNRFLSTRDLFGRVDVETDDVNAIKEVSSRDGGLIQTEASNQLMEYFTLIHRRLERYVAGVLWGEAFIRREYFKNEKKALEERKKLLTIDKDLNSADYLFSSIGSKVDFLQLIKNLVNDDKITILYYNNELADIVSNPSDIEIIQMQLVEDARKVAEQANDVYMLNKIKQFEQHMDELRRQKEEAERKAEEERIKAQKAQEKALEEQHKREEEELKRREAEKERDAQKQRAIYLSATRNTTQEVQDITHAISVSSTSLLSLISTLAREIELDNLSPKQQLEKIHEIGFFANKIKQLSLLITKADIVALKAKTKVDVPKYIKEYVSNFSNSASIIVHNTTPEASTLKLLSLLDIGIVLDNLISNSIKAEAKNILLTIKNDDNVISVDFSDDGTGVNLEEFTSDSIFEEGVTNRRGGSGIGLHTVKYTMEERLHGSIEYVGNGLHNLKGATFRLTFN
ncbi:MAG: ATP-binding protein [Bacteroidales bacterium]|nr:ATP-binding protein [Bacteroidales bacterium]